jgi:hypothetical protein
MISPTGGAPEPAGRPFLWATGIEDTFITDPWPSTGRTLDEYELTQHYRFWREDLERVAELGANAARYGIPWYRVNPAPGRFDWSWPDQTFDRLLAAGILPIVDLVHYGTPAWLEGSFLNPDYPHRVAEYAGRLAERFADRIRWFTPLNEPRITAWYSGKVGHWPPNQRGWRGFTQVMLSLARGICETVHAIESVVKDPTFVHVDATDLYVSDDLALAEEVRLRQQIGFLALDLVSGRVDEAHPLWSWLQRQGMRAADAAWFAVRRVPLSLCGLNMYPMFSQKRLVRRGGSLRQQMPFAPASVLARLIDLYWERYRVPLMITETAARGEVWRRGRWLDASVEVVSQARRRGIPVTGYTWWPLFALVSWPYRQGTQPVGAYLEQMGLWDLVPEPDGTLRREWTPLVDRYRQHVQRGIDPLIGGLKTGPGG